MRIRGRRCERRGHDWFPGHGPHQFVACTDVCLHCKATRLHKPWGECLGRHPLAEHYADDGRVLPAALCLAPR